MKYIFICFCLWLARQTVYSNSFAIHPSEEAALIAIAKRWDIDCAAQIMGICMSGYCGRTTRRLSVICNCSRSPCRVKRLTVNARYPDGPVPAGIFNLTGLTELDLSESMISGPLPPEISKLSFLETLNLSQNNLSGAIPVELGNLTQLRVLNLSQNNLSGTLPAVVGSLTGLRVLTLSSNRFSGPIPTELRMLNYLEELYIDSSGLTGDIPPELGELSNLQKLWAFDNHFTGKLPEFLGRLTTLEDLRIHGTELEGPIPSSYASLKNLKELRLGDLTKAESNISFLEGLTNLSILSLRNCLLVGPLHDWLGSLKNLGYLDLSFNKLSGQIPRSLEKLGALKFLFLGSNNLSGILPELRSLTALDISFNGISAEHLPKLDRPGFSENFIGTFINSTTTTVGLDGDTLSCLRPGSSCVSNGTPFKRTSISINCGGQPLAAYSLYGDSKLLGAADFYFNADELWLVSSSASLFFPSGSSVSSTAATGAEIMETSMPEAYQTARISTGSLRYFAFGMEPGLFTVDLHFAEIVLDDRPGLGRRLFDVFLQGERVLRDFNIREEAGGSRRALVKHFEVNVRANGIIDLHFFWAGRGTCCIPGPGDFGPLVSAINISRAPEEENPPEMSRRRSVKMKKEILVGIVFGCVAALQIAASVIYLWWKKDDGTGHNWVHVDSQK